MKKTLLALVTCLATCVSAFAANPLVEIKTNMGVMRAELYPEKAPKTVDNFLQYVNENFFNGTIFHRVIDGFMIQGGGFNEKLEEKPTRAPIQNEARNGLRNEIGTLAMARTRDPHSASAQFFVNLVDNNRLDYPSFDGWGYAVFGKVTQGLDVVRKIGKVPTGNSGSHQNVPVKPVIIESVRLLQAGQ